MTIEGSFGMLVNKWAILQGPIKMSISRTPIVIKDSMTLHILIITHNLPTAPPLKSPVSFPQSEQHHLHTTVDWRCLG